MIEIRDVEEEDINNGLLEVYIEGYRYHQNGRPDIFIDLTDEELKKDLLEIIEKEKVLVLVKDSRVVAYLSYIIKERHTKKLDMDQIVVLEKYRKNGYGKMLIDKVLEIGRELKCDRIEFNCWTFNSNAIDAYDHMGFIHQRIQYEMKL